MRHTVSQHNAPAIKLVTGRYSARVQRFHCRPDLTEADSDEHFWLIRELAELATAALTRAPKIKPTGNRAALLAATDLGNVHIAMGRAFTDAERVRYGQILEALEALEDKYEG